MKLEVKNIHKSFGEKEVLHGISFSVESGKALGLLGRNGAGKTTTIRILMSVFKANQGMVTVDGKPFKPMQYQIGYLPEERGLYPQKIVSEQLLYLAELRGIKGKQAKKSMKYWLDRLGVGEYENRKLDTLSKGNQQKVQLAQTLICNPDIIILDEPFSGLDPVNSQILKDVIREQIEIGKLVIFSSHQMSYVEEFCEDIVIINHGEVVLDGNLQEIKREYARDRLVLGILNKKLEELKVLAERELADCTAVVGTRKLQGQIILQLKAGKSSLDVMEKLVQLGLPVETFGIYEPSLTEIFVERAGDEE